MGDFNWVVPWEGVSPGQEDRQEVEEMPPAAVPICQGMPAPPSPPRCLCRPGSSRRWVPLGEDREGEGPAASPVLFQHTAQRLEGPLRVG